MKSFKYQIIPPLLFLPFLTISISLLLSIWLYESSAQRFQTYSKESLEATEISNLLQQNQFSTSIVNAKLSYYIQLVNLMATYMENLNTGNLISSSVKAVFDTNPLLEDHNYNEAYFHSKYFPYISNATLDLTETTKAMIGIFPHINEQSIYAMYFGFETDELTYLYPGAILPEDYSPIVREWYYQAIESPGIVLITEPYVDAILDVIVISLSKSLENNDGIYGVTAIDLTLDNFKEVLLYDSNSTNFFITYNGFMIISPWDYPIEVMIFQETFTGISRTLWDSILDESLNRDYEFKFAVLGEDYTCIRNFIKVGNEDIKYILMSCVAKKPDQKYPTYLDNPEILWVLICIILMAAIVYLGISCGLIFKLQAEFDLLKEHFDQWLNNALKSDLRLCADQIRQKRMYFVGNIGKLARKLVDKINKKQEKYQGFSWEQTRPFDYFLQSRSTLKGFPHNTTGQLLVHDRIHLVNCLSLHLK